MAPRWRDRPGPLDGPAPRWPGLVERVAERWAGASARARLLVVLGSALVAAALVATAGEPSIVTVTARRDLAPGERLGRELVTVAERPRSLVPADAVLDPAAVIGELLRHPVAAGQPLLRRSIVAGVDASLAPGRVALALPGDLVPTLEPGQRLDVVGADATGVPRVLAADALVLRVDGDGVWVEVDRDASAGLGHAIAWGGLTVAVLPADP